MSEDKILAGSGKSSLTEKVLSGEGQEAATATPVANEATSLPQRLSLSTETGGLKQLPADYDTPDGDWRLIQSENPFEVLYLDYQLYKLINPDMVTANYTILEKFWNDKVMLMNTGGNRIAFKNKYGEGTVEGSLVKLRRAYGKLNSSEGIEQYYVEINSKRISNGEAGLKVSIEHMMIDGSADKTEINFCINRGLIYELTAEEAAIIIKKNLDAGGFKPYGEVTGNSIIDQLLSVESWKTQAKFEEAERLKRDRDLLKIQILPGKYATTINEIGSILFEDPAESKKLIKRELLHKAIAQKDVVLACTIEDLAKENDIDIAFLKIIYTLNPSLPFAFTTEKYAKTVQELCRLAFENEQTLKLYKEHFKKGYIETWLNATNTDAHQHFLKIRNNAENIDLAILEFLYTFDPSLPYRFAGSIFVNTPDELCTAIDTNKETWAAGVKELFDSSILIWLKMIQQQAIVAEWDRAKDSFKSQPDVGLEHFLHLLDQSLAHTNISTNQISIRYPKIQSGRIVKTEIVFRNETRGCVSAYLSFSRSFPGISISPGSVLINNAAGVSQGVVSLEIDTSVLLKGVHYETSLHVFTSGQQEIDIPVSFKIVFPKNAFWSVVAKYSMLIATFFVLTRLLIATDYADWLINSHKYYIDWRIAIANLSYYSLFGWSFFLLMALFTGFAYFLIKSWTKK